MSDDDTTSIGRNPTGIPGLDDVLGGGLFVGGVYLITGRPGAAKTLASNQIAFAHVGRGGRALYVTLLAESHARMLALMESMSFFRPEVVGNSLLYLSGYQVLEKEKLAGLIRILRTAVRDHQATLLVIDGLMTVRDLSGSDIDLKKFIHEVQVLTELSACTTVLLRGANEIEENYPERTMADGVILLSTQRVGMRSVREIEVQKHRGSAHVMGSSFFEVSSTGLTIYPRAEARIGMDMASRDIGEAALVPTGVSSLDALMEGGVPAGSTTMLLGSPGIGKTLLGLHFLAAGARAKEPGLYFGFNESPARILRKAQAIGLDLASYSKHGLLDIQWHAPQEPIADRLVEALLDNIRRRRVRRVFLDGFEGFRAGLLYAERIQPFAIGLTNELRALGVTALMSEEISGVFGPELVIPHGASEIVDNILFLRHVELRSQIRRSISVLKMRDHHYDTSLRELLITPSGVQIAGLFEAGLAITTGVAHQVTAPPKRSTPRRSTSKRTEGRRRARG